MIFFWSKVIRNQGLDVANMQTRSILVCVDEITPTLATIVSSHPYITPSKIRISQPSLEIFALSEYFFNLEISTRPEPRQVGLCSNI